MVKSTTAANRVVTTMFSAFLQREGIWWDPGSRDMERIKEEEEK